MRIRRPMLASLTCLATLGAAAFAFQPQPSDPPPSREPGQRPPGEGPRRGPGERGRPDAISVEGAMKGMNRALKQLGGQLSQAEKHDDNLRLINDAERFCVAAKGQPVPADVLESAKDDAARAAMSKTFRADLIAVLRKLVDIESAIADDKPDEARKLIDEVVKLRHQGHDAMGIDDDE